jgi:hypothetical protein
MEGYQPLVLTTQQLELDSLGVAVEFPKLLLGDDLCFQRCFWFLTGETCGLKPGALGAENRDFLQKDGRFPVGFDGDILGPIPLLSLRTLRAGEFLVRLHPQTPGHMGHWVVLTPEGIFDPSHGSEAIGRKALPVVQWTGAWNNVFMIARIHGYLKKIS